jgi:hypothetical protein
MGVFSVRSGALGPRRGHVIWSGVLAVPVVRQPPELRLPLLAAAFRTSCPVRLLLGADMSSPQKRSSTRHNTKATPDNRLIGVDPLQLAEPSRRYRIGLHVRLQHPFMWT